MLAYAGDVADELGIPANIAQNLIRTESGGRANAVSSKGAFGPAQLMPDTARELAAKYGGNPADPRDNIRLGLSYLRDNFDQFGDWTQAAAAYHAGPGAVRKSGGIPNTSDGNMTTRQYVDRIVGASDQAERKESAWRGTYADPDAVNAIPVATTQTRQGNDVDWGKEFSAAVDSWQSNLLAIPAAMGSEWALKSMLENKAEAEKAWSESGAPQKWDDVKFGENFGKYFGHLFVQSAPYLGEFVATGFGVGSLLKRVAIGTAEKIAQKATTEALRIGATKEAAEKAGQAAANAFFGTAGGVIGSYPSSTGDVLSNQYEQSQKFDIPSAGALGIPYAALNAVGGEGMLLRGMARGLPNISRTVAGKGIVGAAGRAAITGAEAGALGGGSEFGQEVINQAGRMAVDPNATLTSGDAPDRYKESLIAGGLMSGVPGAIAGPFRKPEPIPPQRQPNSPLTNAANVGGVPPAGPAPLAGNDSISSDPLSSDPQMSARLQAIDAALSDRDLLARVRNINPDLVDQAFYARNAIIGNADLPLKTRLNALDQLESAINNLPNWTNGDDRRGPPPGGTPNVPAAPAQTSVGRARPIETGNTYEGEATREGTLPRQRLEGPQDASRNATGTDEHLLAQSPQGEAPVVPGSGAMAGRYAGGLAPFVDRPAPVPVPGRPKTLAVGTAQPQALTQGTENGNQAAQAVVGTAVIPGNTAVTEKPSTGESPAAQSGGITASGQYRDGGTWIAEYSTEPRTDGTVGLVRTFTDSDGRREEHLGEDGTWHKGRPAKTAVFRPGGEGTGPEAFPRVEDAMSAARDDAQGMGGSIAAAPSAQTVPAPSQGEASQQGGGQNAPTLTEYPPTPKPESGAPQGVVQPKAQPVAPAASSFDSAAWDKAREDRIKVSKESGAKHLDDVAPSVETMRGKEIFYVHNPQQRGVIRTVDNRGNVYVYWSDKSSAEKELASEAVEDNAAWLKSSRGLPYMRENRSGKTYVMRSSLGPTDLKDYVFASSAVPLATKNAEIVNRTDNQQGQSNAQTPPTLPLRGEPAPDARPVVGDEGRNAAQPASAAAPVQAAETSFERRKDGTIAVRGYTKEQIKAAAAKLGVRVGVGENGNAVFSIKTPLTPLKEILNPGTAYLPTKEEVAGMENLFPEFVENGKFNTRKAYNHAQKHGTQRFHDKADAQAYAEALERGEGGKWEPKRVNAKNGQMSYWHVVRSVGEQPLSANNVTALAQNTPDSEKKTEGGKFVRDGGIESLNDAERELRSISKDTESPGDVLLNNGKYAPFDAVVKLAREGIESGAFRAVPAQLHYNVDMAMRDVDRVLKAVKEQIGQIGQPAPAQERQESSHVSERDQAWADLGEGIDELVSLLGVKMNLTPEEETRFLPIMSKIFRAAAKLGYLTFKDSARFVINQIRGKSQEVADRLSIDNLQAGYFNVVSSLGVDTKAEKAAALKFDSIDELMADHDAKREQIAAAEARVDPDPTEAQIEAGNYRKGSFSWRGQKITIETPKGATRSGTDKDGAAWQVTMPVTYGYVNGTVAPDKDHVDIFMGPNPDAPFFWVMNQQKVDGGYDEPKILAGFDSPQDAVEAYNASFTDGFAYKVRGPLSAAVPAERIGEVLPLLEKRSPFDALDGFYPVGEGNLIYDKWVGAGIKNKLTPAMRELVDRVKQALADGVFYTKDMHQRITAEYQGRLPADYATRRTKEVEGGDWGMEISYAREVAQAENDRALREQTAKELNLQVGQKLGTLIFQDGKVTRAAEVKEVGENIVLTGKRGPQTVQITADVVAIKHAIERADRKFPDRKAKPETVPETNQNEIPNDPALARIPDALRADAQAIVRLHAIVGTKNAKGEPLSLADIADAIAKQPEGADLAAVTKETLNNALDKAKGQLIGNAQGAFMAAFDKFGSETQTLAAVRNGALDIANEPWAADFYDLFKIDPAKIQRQETADDEGVAAQLAKFQAGVFALPSKVAWNMSGPDKDESFKAAQASNDARARDYTKAARLFLEGDLTAKVPGERDEKLNLEFLENVRVKPIEKAVKRVKNYADQNKALLAAAADQDIRYYLQGIHVEDKRLVVTDGARLAVLEDADLSGLPARDGEKTVLNRYFGEKKGAKNAEPHIQWLDGRYPDWRRVVPEKHHANVGEFNAKRIADQARGLVKAWRYTNNKGYSQIDIAIGDERVHFNAQYVMDAADMFRAFGYETFTASIDGGSPMLLTSPDGRLKQVIMPMRTKSEVPTFLPLVPDADVAKQAQVATKDAPETKEPDEFERRGIDLENRGVEKSQVRKAVEEARAGDDELLRDLERIAGVEREAQPVAAEPPAYRDISQADLDEYTRQINTVSRPALTDLTRPTDEVIATINRIADGATAEPTFGPAQGKRKELKDYAEDVIAAIRKSRDKSQRHFKDIDSLNALNNPLGEDDWVRLADGSEWQVKGRMTGWALVKEDGKTEHPAVKNIMGQVPFIRAVIEANEAAKTPATGFIKAPDGSIDFGEITPEMSKKMRRQAGKIRLTRGIQNADGTGYGLVHIEANHGMQIRGAGFASVEEFIAHVAKDFKQVWQATGSQLLAAYRDGEQHMMYVQLEPARDENGDYYRVNTAFPVRQEDYPEKHGFKKLWDGSEPASAVAGEQPAFAGTPEVQSGQDTPNARGQSDSSVAEESPDANTFTEAEALKRMAWQDMGTEKGIRTYRLQFFDAEGNMETGRGAMNHAYIEQSVGKGGDKKFRVYSRGGDYLGDAGALDSLRVAKKIGEGASLESIREDGYLRDETVGETAKEPWQMTRSEFVNAVRNGRDFKQLGVNPTPLSTLRAAKDYDTLDRQAADHHNGVVTMAFAEGKPVPAEVLADYPELQKLQAQNETTEESSAVPEKSGTYTLAEHQDLMDRLGKGEVSLEEYKSAFERLRSSKDALTAELSALTKDGIMRAGHLSAHYKNDNKDRLVKFAADSIADDFHLGESMAYVMGQRDATVISYVKDATADTLAEYAARRKARIAEYVEQRKAMLKGIENPQSIEDFENYLRFKKSESMDFQQARMSLTPEQRAQYDLLRAEKSRADRAYQSEQKREVRAAAQTTEGQVFETKHTRTGEPLFVVKAAERVEREVYNQWNATAKKLGGYYSSYRGGGAIPGFQFKMRENADAFLAYLGGQTAPAQAVAAERRDAFADDKSQSAAERLNEMADRLEGQADEELGRERLANTHRRAGMAARAEAAANSDKALAQTMRNIAQALTDGTAKFLDRVRQKAQVETLRKFVHVAQYTEHRAKYDSYVEQEKHKGEKPTTETADYAEFPTYTTFRSNLATLARQMMEIDGAKKTGAALLKVADDVTEAYAKFARENFHKVSGYATKDGKPALFGTSDAAEAAIARSGFKGKAVPFHFKRGQWGIIHSPGAARERGIWQGDDDKRITISADLGEEIVAAKKRHPRLDMPWVFQNVAEDRARLKALGIETPAEFRTALREFIGLQEAPREPDRIKELERKMIGRANDGLDFFPTPAGTAQAMIDAAEIKEGMTVLEPSAGMGHIADQIREAGFEPDVVELASDRRELLQEKGYNLVGNDFMDVAGGYDRIILNPPFGDRRDAQHVQHAYELLKPGGRLVALMGEGVFFGQDKKAQAFRDWLESVGGTSEKLDEGTFLDKSLPVTTGTNARMVVVERPSNEVQQGTYTDDYAQSAREFNAPVDAGQVSTAAEDEGKHAASVPGAKERGLDSDAARRGIGPENTDTGIPDDGILDEGIGHKDEARNERSLSGAIRTDGERVGRYLRYSVVANGVARDFRDRGATRLIGQKIGNPFDLAVAAQVYRNPKVETMRYFFVKDGHIVGQTAVSSRKPGNSAIFAGRTEKERADFIDEIDRQMEALGADTLWILHNHPDGVPVPSASDIAATDTIAKEFESRNIEVAGHVIINQNKYGVITLDPVDGPIPNVSVHDFGESAQYDIANPKRAHALLGRHIGGGADVAEAAKRAQVSPGQVVIIGVSGSSGIRVISEVTPTQLKGKFGAGILRRIAKQTGSDRLFAYGIGKSDIELAKKAIETGFLFDAIAVDGDKEYSVVGLTGARKAPGYSLGTMNHGRQVETTNDDVAILNDTLAEHFNDESWRDAYRTPVLSDADAEQWAGIQRGFLKGFDRRVVAVSPVGIKESRGESTFRATDIRYSKEGAPTNTTPSAIRAAFVNAFGEETVSGLEANGLVEIVADVADLPYGLKPSRTGKAFWVPELGKAYFIANRMNAATAPREMLHEIGEHAGLEGMLGEKGYASLIRRVRTMEKAGNQRIRQAFAFVHEKYPELPESSDKFMREVLANVGQDANIQARPWWKEIIQAVRRYLVKFGFTKGVTESDIQDMVLHSLKTLAKPKGGPAGGMRLAGAMASEQASTLYSQLARAIHQAPGKIDNGPATQWKAWLLGNAEKLKVKKDEIQWSGVLDWLDLRGKEKTSKADVVEFLNGNGVRVEEVTLNDSSAGEVDNRLYDWAKQRPSDEQDTRTFGAVMSGESYDAIRRAAEKDGISEVTDILDLLTEKTKFSSYVPPGGKPGSYRELLLMLPEISDNAAELRAEYQPAVDAALEKGDVTEAVRLQKERDDKIYARRQQAEKLFRSSHFDQPNILAHLRVDEVEGANGERLLRVVELQSDWAQTGRKEGFDTKQYAVMYRNADGYMVRDSTTNNRAEAERDAATLDDGIVIEEKVGVPSAPFVTDTQAWLSLALKKAISYAAENGFDGVVFATGQQNADLYDLSKQIKSINYLRVADDYWVQAIGNDGRTVFDSVKKENELEDVVGKEVAQKMIDGEGAVRRDTLWPQQPTGVSYKRLSGLDLKVGGEGMRAFYDEIVPSVANKVLKQIGADAKVGGVKLEDGEQPGFILTDNLKEAALNGLPMFSKGDFMESRRKPMDVYQKRAYQLEQAFEAMGLTVHIDGSRVSKSTYVEVESPGYTASEGERGERIKFRVSDHELPRSYAQPDFDVIADGVEHGGVMWNKSGTWVEAVEWLAQNWNLPAPAVVRQTRAREETQARKDAVRMKNAAVRYAQERLDEFDVAVADGKVSGRKTNSGAWMLTGVPYVDLGKHPGESFSLDKAIALAREKFVAEVEQRTREAEGAPTPDSRELGSQASRNEMQERPAVRADESGSPEEPAQSGSGAGSTANLARSRAGSQSIDIMESRGELDEIGGDALRNLRPAPAYDAIRNPDRWYDHVIAKGVEMLKGSDKFGALDKSVHTQLHKAQKNPYFGEVFKRIQHFMADASRAALRPSELAPTILPRIDVVGSIKPALRTLLKGKEASNDINAAFQSVLRGTLSDTVYDTAEEAELSEEQFKLYREYREAIDASLDELSAAEAYAVARSLFVKNGKQLRAGLEMKKAALDNPTEARSVIAGTLENMLEDAALREDAEAIEPLQDALNKVNAIFDNRDRLQQEGYAPLMRFGQYSLTIKRIDPTTGEVEVDENGEPQTEYFGLFESEAERDKARRLFEEEYGGNPYVMIDHGTISEEEWKLYKGVSPESVALFAGKLGIGGDQVFQQWYRSATSNRSALKRLLHRKGVAGFSEDGARVLAAFLTSNGRRASMQYHLSDVQEAVDTFPKSQGIEKDEAVKLLDYVQNPQEEMHTVRALMFAHYLGGSLSNFFINATQPIMVTLPYLSQYVGMGRAKSLLWDAYGMVRKPETIPEEIRAALDQAEQEGVVGANEIHHLWQETARPLASKLSRYGDKVTYRFNAFMQIWGMPFALAEHLNRQSTFIAAYNAAKETGASKQGAYAKAIRAVNDTQFVYGKQNRPDWARGNLGSLVFTFKLFSLSYVELLTRLMRGNTESRKAALYMLGLLFLAAGANGMPGGDDLDDLIDTIAQSLGYNTSMKLSKRKFVEDLAGKQMGQLILNGLSSMTPLDVQTRFSLGNLIPGTGLLKPSNTKKESDILEIIGPAGGLANSYINAADAVQTGNFGRFLTEVSPKFFKDAMGGYEMASTGEARDGRGRKVTDVDAFDAFIKAIGFNPQAVASESKAIRSVQQQISFAKRQEGLIAEQWARGIYEGKPNEIADARNQQAQWNAMNPETPIKIKISQVARRVNEMRATREQRFLKSATKDMREYAREAID